MFSRPTVDEQRDGIYLYCILFAGTGFVCFFAHLLQISMFAVSGENMTKRIRSECFKAMLSQDLEWFDRPENVSVRVVVVQKFILF